MFWSKVVVKRYKKYFFYVFYFSLHEWWDDEKDHIITDIIISPRCLTCVCLTFPRLKKGKNTTRAALRSVQLVMVLGRGSVDSTLSGWVLLGRCESCCCPAASGNVPHVCVNSLPTAGCRLSPPHFSTACPLDSVGQWHHWSSLLWCRELVLLETFDRHRWPKTVGMKMISVFKQFSKEVYLRAPL